MRLFFWRQRGETARDARELWLKWMELSGGFSPRTIDGYRRTTDKLLKQWPDLRLDQFTSELLEEFVEQASQRSRQQRRGPLQNFFTWAHRTKRIAENPMLRVQTYKAPPLLPPDVFTLSECKILEALPFPDGTLIALLLGTGMRKSEARHLTVKRIKFEQRELHIVEGAKGGSTGVVPLTPELLVRLDELITLEGLGDEDFLWYSHRGGSTKRKHDRPLSDGAMHAWWTSCVEKSGVPYRHLHVTRHSFATHWRRRGLHLDDVSFLLRHADPRTTSRHYVHLTTLDIRKRMDECMTRDEALA